MLYLSVCFYLLPALGSTLKIRKRKLAQVTANSDSVAVVDNDLFVESTKQTLVGFSTKFSTLIASPSKDTAALTKSLGSISIKFEASREFNLNVYSQAQRVSLLNS